jgi:hypothetical protein
MLLWLTLEITVTAAYGRKALQTLNQFDAAFTVMEELRGNLETEPD